MGLEIMTGRSNVGFPYSQDELSAMLGRKIPDEELLSTSYRELQLLIASLKEEKEMLQEELDFVKGYPVNGISD